MNTTPTPEDYSISPEEALDINAKATKGKWRGLPDPYDDWGIIRSDIDNYPVASTMMYARTTDEEMHECRRNRTPPIEISANARAIAYNHNNTPGLARLLIAEREERKRLEDAILNWHKKQPTLDFTGLYALSDVAVNIKKKRADADRIKAGRAAQNGD